MAGTPQQQLIWLDGVDCLSVWCVCIKLQVQEVSQWVACAVTVRDILARYEVGETVGVGGAAFVSFFKLRQDVRWRTPSVQQIADCAGFAVVKRGRDKKTGEIVAIKVNASAGCIRWLSYLIIIHCPIQ